MTASTERPALLLLVHRIPFPPDKGDKIRSYHLLQYLLRHFQVYLGTFIDDPADIAHQAALREQCAECCFVERNSKLRKLASLRGLLTAQPLTLPYYASARMQRWVDRVVQEKGIRKAIAFSSATAQFLMYRRFSPMRRVMDFIDIDSDKWAQYAERARFPMSRLYRREARTLLAYERKVCGTFDASTFVSEQEAAMFRKLAGGHGERITAISNGVDLDRFSPQARLDNPFPQAPSSRRLVFVGAMDYWPNVDAVQWFAHEVLPLLRKHLLVEFWIVGANPAKEVKALQSLPGVQVTGRVADVRQYVGHADVSVAPLRVARGIQNKVLESLAMARPTVVTTPALEGIPAIPGEHLLLADEPAGLVQQIIGLLQGNIDAGEMGSRARQLMEAHFSWQATLAKFGRLLQVD